MFISFHTPKTAPARTLTTLIAFMTFVATSLSPVPVVFAQNIALPPVGEMIPLSTPYTPTHLLGIEVNPQNPMRMNFFVHRNDYFAGDSAFQAETDKLIKYFLTALTLPEDHLWVNLSPYEKDRILEQDLGQTEMGLDMLAQDYLLKQIMASLMYPEEGAGETFWSNVYQKLQQQLGTTDIPLDTFNKVWIVPDEAIVYEEDTTAWVAHTHLKVMLEKDYLALTQNSLQNYKSSTTESPAEKISADTVRSVLLPVLEEEVNNGEHFAKLRQIVSSMVLATWYKRRLKASFLGQNYVDKGKILGIQTDEADTKEQIYNQYLESFKIGVFDYIKEEFDPRTQEVIPRKYFSGGLAYKEENVASVTDLSSLASDTREQILYDMAMLMQNTEVVDVRLDGVNAQGQTLDLAMKTADDFSRMALAEIAQSYKESQTKMIAALDKKDEQAFESLYQETLTLLPELEKTTSLTSDNEWQTFLNTEGAQEGSPEATVLRDFLSWTGRNQFPSEIKREIDTIIEEVVQELWDSPKEQERWRTQLKEDIRPVAFSEQFPLDLIKKDFKKYAPMAADLMRQIIMNTSGAFGSFDPHITKRISLRPEYDPLLELRTTLKHEMIHYLAYHNVFRMPAEWEDITIVMEVIEYIREQGEANLESFSETLVGEASVALFQAGKEMGLSGETGFMVDPNISDQKAGYFMTDFLFAKAQEIYDDNGLSVDILQNSYTAQRAVGIILAGVLLGMKENNPDMNIMRLLKDFFDILWERYGTTEDNPNLERQLASIEDEIQGFIGPRVEMVPGAQGFSRYEKISDFKQRYIWTPSDIRPRGYDGESFEKQINAARERGLGQAFLARNKILHGYQNLQKQLPAEMQDHPALQPFWETLLFSKMMSFSMEEHQNALQSNRLETRFKGSSLWVMRVLRDRYEMGDSAAAKLVAQGLFSSLPIHLRYLDSLIYRRYHGNPKTGENMHDPRVVKEDLRNLILETRGNGDTNGWAKMLFKSQDLTEADITTITAELWPSYLKLYEEAVRMEELWRAYQRQMEEEQERISKEMFEQYMENAAFQQAMQEFFESLPQEVQDAIQEASQEAMQELNQQFQSSSTPNTMGMPMPSDQQGQGQPQPGGQGQSQASAGKSIESLEKGLEGLDQQLSQIESQIAQTGEALKDINQKSNELNSSSQGLPEETQQQNKEASAKIEEAAKGIQDSVQELLEQGRSIAEEGQNQNQQTKGIQQALPSPEQGRESSQNSEAVAGKTQELLDKIKELQEKANQLAQASKELSSKTQEPQAEEGQIQSLAQKVQQQAESLKQTSNETTGSNRELEKALHQLQKTISDLEKSVNEQEKNRQNPQSAENQASKAVSEAQNQASAEQQSNNSESSQSTQSQPASETASDPTTPREAGIDNPENLIIENATSLQEELNAQQTNTPPPVNTIQATPRDEREAREREIENLLLTTGLTPEQYNELQKYYRIEVSDGQTTMTLEDLIQETKEKLAKLTLPVQGFGLKTGLERGQIYRDPVADELEEGGFANVIKTQPLEIKIGYLIDRSLSMADPITGEEYTAIQMARILSFLMINVLLDHNEERRRLGFPPIQFSITPFDSNPEEDPLISFEQVESDNFIKESVLYNLLQELKAQGGTHFAENLGDQLDYLLKGSTPGDGVVRMAVILTDEDVDAEQKGEVLGIMEEALDKGAKIFLIPHGDSNLVQQTQTLHQDHPELIVPALPFTELPSRMFDAFLTAIEEASPFAADLLSQEDLAMMSKPTDQERVPGFNHFYHQEINGGRYLVYYSDEGKIPVRFQFELGFGGKNVSREYIPASGDNEKQILKTLLSMWRPNMAHPRAVFAKQHNLLVRQIFNGLLEISRKDKDENLSPVHIFNPQSLIETEADTDGRKVALNDQQIRWRKTAEDNRLHISQSNGDYLQTDIQTKEQTDQWMIYEEDAETMYAFNRETYQFKILQKKTDQWETIETLQLFQETPGTKTEGKFTELIGETGTGKDVTLNTISYLTQREIFHQTAHADRLVDDTVTGRRQKTSGKSGFEATIFARGMHTGAIFVLDERQKLPSEVFNAWKAFITDKTHKWPDSVGAIDQLLTQKNAPNSIFVTTANRKRDGIQGTNWLENNPIMQERKTEVGFERQHPENEKEWLTEYALRFARALGNHEDDWENFEQSIRSDITELTNISVDLYLQFLGYDTFQITAIMADWQLLDTTYLTMKMAQDEKIQELFENGPQYAIGHQLKRPPSGRVMKNIISHFIQYPQDRLYRPSSIIEMYYNFEAMREQKTYRVAQNNFEQWQGRDDRKYNAIRFDINPNLQENESFRVEENTLVISPQSAEEGTSLWDELRISLHPEAQIRQGYLPDTLVNWLKKEENRLIFYKTLQAHSMGLGINLVGIPGTGKSTFKEVVQDLLGGKTKYTSYITDQTRVDQLTFQVDTDREDSYHTPLDVPNAMLDGKRHGSPMGFEEFNQGRSDMLAFLNELLNSRILEDPRAGGESIKAGVGFLPIFLMNDPLSSLGVREVPDDLQERMVTFRFDPLPPSEALEYLIEETTVETNEGLFQINPDLLGKPIVDENNPNTILTYADGTQRFDGLIGLVQELNRRKQDDRLGKLLPKNRSVGYRVLQEALKRKLFDTYELQYAEGKSNQEIVFTAFIEALGLEGDVKQKLGWKQEIRNVFEELKLWNSQGEDAIDALLYNGGIKVPALEAMWKPETTDEKLNQIMTTLQKNPLPSVVQRNIGLLTNLLNEKFDQETYTKLTSDERTERAIEALEVYQIIKVIEEERFDPSKGLAYTVADQQKLLGVIDLLGKLVIEQGGWSEDFFTQDLAMKTEDRQKMLQAMKTRIQQKAADINFNDEYIKEAVLKLELNQNNEAYVAKMLTNLENFISKNYGELAQLEKILSFFQTREAGVWGNLVNTLETKREELIEALKNQPQVVETPSGWTLEKITTHLQEIEQKLQNAKQIQNGKSYGPIEFIKTPNEHPLAEINESLKNIHKPVKKAIAYSDSNGEAHSFYLSKGEYLYHLTSNTRFLVSTIATYMGEISDIEPIKINNELFFIVSGGGTERIRIYREDGTHLPYTHPLIQTLIKESDNAPFKVIRLELDGEEKLLFKRDDNARVLLLGLNGSVIGVHPLIDGIQKYMSNPEKNYRTTFYKLNGEGRLLLEQLSTTGAREDVRSFTLEGKQLEDLYIHQIKPLSTEENQSAANFLFYETETEAVFSILSTIDEPLEYNYQTSNVLRQSVTAVTPKEQAELANLREEKRLLENLREAKEQLAQAAAAPASTTSDAPQIIPENEYPDLFASIQETLKEEFTEKKRPFQYDRGVNDIFSYTTKDSDTRIIAVSNLFTGEEDEGEASYQKIVEISEEGTILEESPLIQGILNTLGTKFRGSIIPTLRNGKNEFIVIYHRPDDVFPSKVYLFNEEGQPLSTRRHTLVKNLQQILDLENKFLQKPALFTHQGEQRWLLIGAQKTYELTKNGGNMKGDELILADKIDAIRKKVTDTKDFKDDLDNLKNSPIRDKLLSFLNDGAVPTPSFEVNGQAHYLLRSDIRNGLYLITQEQIYTEENHPLLQRIKKDFLAVSTVMPISKVNGSPRILVGGYQYNNSTDVGLSKTVEYTLEGEEVLSSDLADSFEGELIGSTTHTVTTSLPNEESYTYILGKSRELGKVGPPITRNILLKQTASETTEASAVDTTNLEERIAIIEEQVTVVQKQAELNTQLATDTDTSSQEYRKVQLLPNNHPFQRLMGLIPYNESPEKIIPYTADDGTPTLIVLKKNKTPYAITKKDKRHTPELITKIFEKLTEEGDLLHDMELFTTNEDLTYIIVSTLKGQTFLFNEDGSPFRHPITEKLARENNGNLFTLTRGEIDGEQVLFTHDTENNHLEILTLNGEKITIEHNILVQTIRNLANEASETKISFYKYSNKNHFLIERIDQNDQIMDPVTLTEEGNVLPQDSVFRKQISERVLGLAYTETKTESVYLASTTYGLFFEDQSSVHGFIQSIGKEGTTETEVNENLIALQQNLEAQSENLEQQLAINQKETLTQTQPLEETKTVAKTYGPWELIEEDHPLDKLIFGIWDSFATDSQNKITRIPTSTDGEFHYLVVGPNDTGVHEFKEDGSYFQKSEIAKNINATVKGAITSMIFGSTDTAPVRLHITNDKGEIFEFSLITKERSTSDLMDAINKALADIQINSQGFTPKVKGIVKYPPSQEGERYVVWGENPATGKSFILLFEEDGTPIDTTTLNKNLNQNFRDPNLLQQILPYPSTSGDIRILAFGHNGRQTALYKADGSRIEDSPLLTAIENFIDQGPLLTDKQLIRKIFVSDITENGTRFFIQGIMSNQHAEITEEGATLSESLLVQKSTNTNAPSLEVRDILRFESSDGETNSIIIGEGNNFALKKLTEKQNTETETQDPVDLTSLKEEKQALQKTSSNLKEEEADIRAGLTAATAQKQKTVTKPLPRYGEILLKKNDTDQIPDQKIDFKFTFPGKNGRAESLLEFSKNLGVIKEDNPNGTVLIKKIQKEFRDATILFARRRYLSNGEQHLLIGGKRKSKGSEERIVREFDEEGNIVNSPLREKIQEELDQTTGEILQFKAIPFISSKESKTLTLNTRQTDPRFSSYTASATIYKEDGTSDTANSLNTAMDVVLRNGTLLDAFAYTAPGGITHFFMIFTDSLGDLTAFELDELGQPAENSSLVTSFKVYAQRQNQFHPRIQYSESEGQLKLWLWFNQNQTNFTVNQSILPAADPAMLEKQLEQKPGGIDINPNNMNLQIESNSEFPVTPNPAFNPAEIHGIIPVILYHSPMTTMPSFVLAEPENTEKAEQESSPEKFTLSRRSW